MIGGRPRVFFGRHTGRVSGGGLGGRLPDEGERVELVHVVIVGLLLLLLLLLLLWRLPSCRCSGGCAASARAVACASASRARASAAACAAAASAAAAAASSALLPVPSAPRVPNKVNTEKTACPGSPTSASEPIARAGTCCCGRQADTAWSAWTREAVSCGGDRVRAGAS